MTASASRNNPDVPPVGRHRARLPRIAYSVAEYADMVGRRPDAVGETSSARCGGKGILGLPISRSEFAPTSRWPRAAGRSLSRAISSLNEDVWRCGPSHVDWPGRA
jgi:hypothetical protein